MKRRILKRVNKIKNGCWEWTGPIKGIGYGYLTIGSRKDGTRKTTTAHRAMWISINGEIKDDLWVLHKCDNPKCVNPKHLYLGTRKDNVRDMIIRGRVRSSGLKHEKHPNSKLKWKDVKNIRKSYVKRGDVNKLAKKFNVNHHTISDILKMKTWIPEHPKDG